MTCNCEEKIISLTERIDRLEKTVNDLNGRTVGLVKIGPNSNISSDGVMEQRFNDLFHANMKGIKNDTAGD